jgi:hypothetical protein
MVFLSGTMKYRSVTQPVLASTPLSGSPPLMLENAPSCSEAPARIDPGRGGLRRGMTEPKLHRFAN